MGKHRLKLHELRRILRSFGVDEDQSGGKGSHTVFRKTFDDGTFTYAVPTSRNEVLPCYVKGCRRRFRLTEDDGVSDDDFFSKA